MTTVHTPPNCNPPAPLDAARSLPPAPLDVTLTAGTVAAIAAAKRVSPIAYSIVVHDSDVSIQNGNGPPFPSIIVQVAASTKCATMKHTTAPRQQRGQASRRAV